MTRMTPAEQLENYAITREVADDARETRNEFRRLDKRIAELEATLRELRLTARVLLQNAEGCAVNHYGQDYQLHGEPGWLRDSRSCIERAEALLPEFGNQTNTLGELTVKLTKEDVERLLSWRVAASADSPADVDLMTRLKEHIADLGVGLLAVSDEDGIVFASRANTAEDLIAKHVHELWSDLGGEFGLLPKTAVAGQLSSNQKKAWERCLEAGHRIIETAEVGTHALRWRRRKAERAADVQKYNEPRQSPLASRNAEIVRQRSEGMSLDDIGQQHGLTKQRVHQIVGE